jgi:hypothetical protein
MATLTRGIALSEFKTMSDSEKHRRVNELFQAAVSPTSEQLEDQRNKLDNQIQLFESRYKMASDEMKRKLATGEVMESADFCRWLMFLKIRGRFEKKRESSRIESV